MKRVAPSVGMKEGIEPLLREGLSLNAVARPTRMCRRFGPPVAQRGPPAGGPDGLRVSASVSTDDRSTLIADE